MRSILGVAIVPLEQDDVDALREGVRVLAQAVMETEVSTQIGAGPYERSSERVAYRNGYRTRRWDTRVGTIELKIPKVTAGAYFPSLLEPNSCSNSRAVCQPIVPFILSRSPQ